MATQLSITNRILRRLREDQVTTITSTDYAQLIADFIADSYEEIVQAHTWQALVHKIQIQLAPSQVTYDLSTYVANGGSVLDSVARLCRDDSVLEYDGNAGSPMIFIYDDAADDSGYVPLVMSRMQLEQQKRVDRDADEDDPSWVAIYSEGGKLKMDVWPIPTAARDVDLWFYTEPAVLAADGTDETTTILLPERPIYQLALMYAYNERGEEIGEPGNIAERRAQDALGAAIEADIFLQQKANEFDWRRD